MKIKKIICCICIVAVALFPAILDATGTEPSQVIQRKQLAVIQQLESSQKLIPSNQQRVQRSNEEWELYCSNEMHDGYKDVTTGCRTYEFFSGTAVLEGMMNYNVYDQAASKEFTRTISKSEEELVDLAKTYLAEIYREDFNNYTYKDIEYWESDHLYHVTFWRYIKGYKIDDPMGITLSGDGEIASYNARERGVYDSFDIDPKEVAVAKEALLAEAEQKWQRSMEILDYFLMYNGEGQKVAVLTVLFDSPDTENMKWTDWLEKPIS